ncbi:MAG: 4-hydroxy-2-oxovalerate aldolase [Rhizobiales bacterium]|nr:4-hydroxy-2-oxovalerate aldolase [Hyphomicrobiales bacterium]
MDCRRDFAERLRGGKPLAGVFVKSRDPAHVEILALAGFDFVVIDAEHAAFGRADITTMTMAARAGGLAALVRIPPDEPGWIGMCLDAGAAGIMVPQVPDAETAANLARRMRFGPGGSGFSPSTPGALYGARGIAGHLEARPEETVLVCQIESPSAVGNAAEIAAIPGVDALLVGPVDLAVSAGFTDPAAAEVAAMSREVLTATKGTAAAGGLFLSDITQIPAWREAGATLFITGTDQGFLASAARRALPAFDDA